MDTTNDFNKTSNQTDEPVITQSETQTDSIQDTASEPEIIHEKYDEPEQKEEKSVISSIFSDLNSDGNANKKLFAITGGVIGVALMTIFVVDAFFMTPAEDKHLDLSKKLTPTPQKKEQVAGAETVGPAGRSDTVAPTSAAQLPKKPTATKAPEPTAEPTKQPDPTATPKPADPTAAPTEAPTATPELTAVPSPTAATN